MKDADARELAAGQTAGTAVLAGTHPDLVQRAVVGRAPEHLDRAACKGVADRRQRVAVR